MGYSWLKFRSISYGWFAMDIGPYFIEVSDFLGYDMPRKFISKVAQVINNNGEEMLYLMNEPRAGILHIYLENKRVHFEKYDLPVDSFGLNNEDEEAEWDKRGKCRFHFDIDIQNAVDGIVTEFSLYERGNGRILYERHWGEFPTKEFEEMKPYAFRLQENNKKYDELFCTTFLGLRFWEE